MFSPASLMCAVWVVATLSFVGCGQNDGHQDSPNHSSGPEEAAGDSDVVEKVPNEPEEATPSNSLESVSPLGRDLCKVSANQLPEKFTITEVVELINLLPKPVSAACIIDLFPKPLNLTLTDSVLSAQPAMDRDNPRIFIKVDSLIVSIVLSGFGSLVMEFSELVTVTISVKGEIELPVVEKLESSAPFVRIIKENSTLETTCGVCHFGERKAPESFPATAFVSNALKPKQSQILSIDWLNELRLGCQTPGSQRCQILESLFLGEVPVEYSFPSDMGVIF